LQIRFALPSRCWREREASPTDLHDDRQDGQEAARFLILCNSVQARATRDAVSTIEKNTLKVCCALVLPSADGVKSHFESGAHSTGVRHLFASRYMAAIISSRDHARWLDLRSSSQLPLDLLWPYPEGLEGDGDGQHEETNPPPLFVPATRWDCADCRSCCVEVIVQAYRNSNLGPIRVQSGSNKHFDRFFCAYKCFV
jgi:hypothetical protein